jgi:hypothetical protein
MKKLLALLFSLFFLSSPSVFADDISDFEIEGISIGDSLLDYMTEDEILKEIESNRNKDSYYFLNEPNKYIQTRSLSNPSTYDGINFFIKNNTQNKYISNKNERYMIKGVNGFLTFNENFDGCIQKSNEIIEIVTEMFPNEEIQEYRRNYDPDPSGNSIENLVMMWFDSGAAISVKCIDIEETFRKKNNWSEGLYLSISSTEIANWLSDYK